MLFALRSVKTSVATGRERDAVRLRMTGRCGDGDERPVRSAADHCIRVLFGDPHVTVGIDRDAERLGIERGLGQHSVARQMA